MSRWFWKLERGKTKSSCFPHLPVQSVENMSLSRKTFSDSPDQFPKIHLQPVRQNRHQTVSGTDQTGRRNRTAKRRIDHRPAHDPIGHRRQRKRTDRISAGRLLPSGRDKTGILDPIGTDRRDRYPAFFQFSSEGAAVMKEERFAGGINAQIREGLERRC